MIAMVITCVVLIVRRYKQLKFEIIPLFLGLVQLTVLLLDNLFDNDIHFMLANSYLSSSILFFINW
jgi:hypothetical protein